MLFKLLVVLSNTDTEVAMLLLYLYAYPASFPFVVSRDFLVAYILLV